MRLPTFRTRRVSATLAALAAGVLLLGACSTGGEGSPEADASGTQSSGEGATGQTGSEKTSQVAAPDLSESSDGAGSDETSTSGEPSDSGQQTSSQASTISVSAMPAFGSTNVSPNEQITLLALRSELQNVTMLGGDGSVIDGEMTQGNRSWTSAGQMKYGVTYTITGDAVGTDGTVKPFSGTIATADPEKTMAAYIQIPNGETVGIAAPIVVTFAGQVAHPAAAEKQLHVSVTDEDGKPLDVVGSWGWMADEVIQKDGPKQSRVHYRPKEFWPANAQIHVEANLYGVDYGEGTWGRENIVRDFKIGPKLEIIADVESHRLLLLKNDEVIRNYPVSYGKPADVDSGRTTVSGIHIVQDKLPGEFEMCNPKYGYCGVKEYWGIRINNNGEFIHVNKKTEAMGLLGKANITHGCINMGMADGKELFHMVYYGVPVTVKNTGVEMSWSDYVYDWWLNWDEWQALSAL